MQAKDPSDRELWDRVLAGEGQAFGTLFDRHRASVFRRAYARLYNRADADDAVAIVFLEAWRHGGRVRFVGDSLLPWLLRATAHVSQNLDRSRRRYTQLLARLPPDDESSEDDLDDRIDLENLWHRLALEVRKLSPLDQAIVELCLIREIPTGDVAAVLGIPVGTVKSRLSRAKSRLKAELSG